MPLVPDRKPVQRTPPLGASEESIAPRRRKRQPRSPLLLIWLLVPVALAGLNWSRVAPYLKPAPPAFPAPASLAFHTHPMEIPAPSPAQPARATPKPLAECMAGGNAVDEQVLRCRFGEVPRPKPNAEPGQGMVSEGYLAKYKAEQSERSSGMDMDRNSGYERWDIPSWDGTKSYLASWQLNGNDIDHSSVCLNYRRGSIDYRECRKAAKQWFKGRCQRAGDNDSGASRRYCSAASSFNPMG